jgi:hypothetical protein
MTKAAMLITITMSHLDVIERVADEAKLDPKDVERVLQLTSENLELAAERHEILVLASGSEKTHVLVALMVVLARAEVEGVLDEPTLGTLRAVRNLAAHGGTVERVLDALLPDNLEIPTPAVVLQARRNAEARSSFLAEFGALRSSEIADLAGSRAANRAALANRWRTENRIVGVTWRDELVYPGFQFTSDGRPLPAMQAALAALRSDPHTTDWQTALWFSTPTSWLGGKRPIDLLNAVPDLVTEAARREVSDRAG